jgi:aryl-alcohol dehydrogenase-like predicted oxidoreductase
LLEEGALTGKYRRKTGEPRRNRSAGKRLMALGDAVVGLAEEIGRSPAQVAINWVRQQRGTIIPIIGTRTETQLKDNLGCLDFELTQEHLDRLSEASPIDLGFPRSFLESGHVRELIFGETHDLIDR